VGVCCGGGLVWDPDDQRGLMMASRRGRLSFGQLGGALLCFGVLVLCCIAALLHWCFGAALLQCCGSRAVCSVQCAHCRLCFVLSMVCVHCAFAMPTSLCPLVSAHWSLPTALCPLLCWRLFGPRDAQTSPDWGPQMAPKSAQTSPIGFAVCAPKRISNFYHFPIT